jgi:hypothetical protein
VLGDEFDGFAQDRLSRARLRRISPQ